MGHFRWIQISYLRVKLAMNPIIYHMSIDQIIIFLWPSSKFLWFSYGFDMDFPHVLEDSHPKSCQSRENSKSLAGRTVGPLGKKNGGVLDWCFLNNGWTHPTWLMLMVHG